jgi:hypothetical protein
MPGTGTLRRSSTPARKKAIVGKSRVEATRLQRLSFVFLALDLVLAEPLWQEFQAKHPQGKHDVAILPKETGLSNSL